MRIDFSEDVADGIMLHVLIAVHGELKDAFYKYKVVPNLIQLSQRHLADTECMSWVMALCYLVMYDQDTFVEERFVVQFMRAHGQELVLKALKVCDEQANVSVEHVARIFVPFVALSETKEGEEWLEKNWLSVARYTELLKNSGLESVDECCRFHGRDLWKRFLAYFEDIQNKYHMQNEAELLEEEFRRQEQQQKRKEKKRQKRQKQREWKGVGTSDSDLVDGYSMQDQMLSEQMSNQDYACDGKKSGDACGSDGGLEAKIREACNEYLHVSDVLSQEPLHQTSIADDNASSWITVESKKSGQLKATGSKIAKAFGFVDKSTGGKKRSGPGKKKSGQRSSPVKLHSNMKWSDVAKGNVVTNTNQTWGQVPTYTDTKPEIETGIPDYEHEFPSLHGKEKSDSGYALSSFESMTDVASESVCSGVTVDFDNDLDQETEGWEYDRSAEESDCQPRAGVCEKFTEGNSGICGIPMWTDFNMKPNPNYYIPQAHPPPPVPPYCVPRAVDPVYFQKPAESLNSIASSLSCQRPMDSLDNVGLSVIYPKHAHVYNYKSNCAVDRKSQGRLITNRELFSKANHCRTVAELEALMKEDVSNPNVDVHRSLSNNSVQEYLNRCDSNRSGTCNKEENSMASFLHKVSSVNTDLDDSKSEAILYPEDLRDDDHSEKGDSSKDDLPYPDTKEMFPGFYDSSDTVVGKGVLALTLEDLAKQQVLEHYKHLADNESIKDNVLFHDFYYYASLYGLTMDDLDKYAKMNDGKREGVHKDIPPIRSGSQCSQMDSELPARICGLTKDSLERAKDDHDAMKDDADSSDSNAVIQGNRPSSPQKLAEAKWSARSRRWKDKLRKILELPMTMRTQYSKIVIPIRTQDFNINPKLVG